MFRTADSVGEDSWARPVFPRHILQWKASLLFWSVQFFFQGTGEIVRLHPARPTLSTSSAIKWKLDQAYYLQYSRTGILGDVSLLLFDSSSCCTISHKLYRLIPLLMLKDQCRVVCIAVQKILSAWIFCIHLKQEVYL